MLRLFEKRHEAEYFCGYKLPKCQSWAGTEEKLICAKTENTGLRLTSKMGSALWWQ